MKQRHIELSGYSGRSLTMEGLQIIIQILKTSHCKLMT